MGSPRLLLPTRPVALVATLLALSGGSAFSASPPGPRPPAEPEAQHKAREQAVQSAIALVHDGAGFSADLPLGTFSDGKPDTRAEIAQAVRKVPEVVTAALKRLDPAAPPAADRVNEAAKLRLATFAGEHTFRRVLAWYEPLLLELGPDMPEPKLTSEQLQTLRAQIREWQAKSATYRGWARKKGGDLPPAVPAKPVKIGNAGNAGNPAVGPFSDVPLAHPAYPAVQVIASIGVFTGYPDNTFGGKRALTRYEFAVALQRMLQDIQRAAPARRNLGDGGHPVRQMSRALPFTTGSPALRLTRGPIGPGAVMPPGPSAADAVQLTRALPWLRTLSEEFDTELAMLGADVAQLKRNVDAFEERLKKQTAPDKPQGAAPGNTL